MDISTGLMAKGAAGALAATAAVGTGVAANNGLLDGIFWEKAESIENAVGSEVVQKRLETAGQKIPEVVTAPSGNTDIRNNSHGGGNEPEHQPASSVNGNPGPKVEGTTEGNEQGQSSIDVVSGLGSDGAGSGIVAAGLQNNGGGSSESTPNKDLTKFDQGLINWLGGDGNDIVFSIKYKDGGKNEKEVKTGDSSISFSSFIGDKSDPVKISVVVNDNSTNLKGDNKASLKQLNGGKKWTWECRMTFKKDKNSNNVNEVNPDQVNRVYGDETNKEKGLFRKLMKDVSANGDNSSEIKELKKKFIENCAKARTKDENEKIETSGLTDDKIETTKDKINFVLKKGESGSVWGENSNKLYFDNKTKFDEWFPANANQ